MEATRIPSPLAYISSHALEFEYESNTPSAGVRGAVHPTKATRAPRGAEWLTELKFDGYRLMLRKQADQVRIYTRCGADWTKRFPRLVSAMRSIKAKSILIDGEGIVYEGKGMPIGVGGFDLDPCAASNSGKRPDRRRARAKAKILLTEADDGLSFPWRGKVFVNPPYVRGIARWVCKCHDEAQRGCVVVALIPARPDTNYWHRFVAGQADVFMLRGRLKFGDGKDAAPFPSLVIWNADQGLLARLSSALPDAWLIERKSETASHRPSLTALRRCPHSNNFGPEIKRCCMPESLKLAQSSTGFEQRKRQRDGSTSSERIDQLPLLRNRSHSTSRIPALHGR